MAHPHGATLLSSTQQRASGLGGQGGPRTHAAEPGRLARRGHLLSRAADCTALWKSKTPETKRQWCREARRGGEDEEVENGGFLGQEKLFCTIA